MNCPFWNPRKVIAFWVQSNKACYPTNLHHTTDWAVTCTQAHFSRKWQTSLFCKWHYNPSSLSPKMKVKRARSKAWSAIDASSNWLLEDDIGNQIPLPHTNDCAITCNTSSFFKEMAKQACVVSDTTIRCHCHPKWRWNKLVARLGLQLML
jgi:hypothetical protein